MPIQIIDGFDLGNSAPVDTRFVVGPTSFYQTKDLITYKYAGMRVWDLNVGLPYVWTGTTWSSEASGYVNVSSGTTNYLPKFTGSNPSNLVINSQVYDTGTNVGIGTTTPSTKLHVIGTIKGTFFDGDGSLITNLNATNIVTGTLNISRLQNGSLGSILVAGAVPTWTGSNLVFVGGANSVSISDEISSSTNHDILFSDPSGLHPSGGRYVKSYQTGTKKIQFNPLSGQLLMNAGSFTSPSYGFIGSNGTGLYLTTGAYPGLSVNYLSSEILRLQSGLSTITSGSLLIGWISFNPFVVYTMFNGASGDPAPNFFANVTPKVDILTGESFGGYSECIVLRHPAIGGFNTPAPTRRLGMLMKMSSESNGNESRKMGGIMLESVDEWANYPGLFFLTEDKKRIQVDHQGNIGLGNVSESATWNRNNIASLSSLFISQANGQCRFRDGTVASPSISFINSTSTGIYTPSTNILSFAASGLEGLRIQLGRALFSDGNESAPSISSINSPSVGIFFPGGNSFSISTGSTEKIRIRSNGNVGIGLPTVVINSQYKLAVNGLVQAWSGQYTKTIVGQTLRVGTSTWFGDVHLLTGQIDSTNKSFIQSVNLDTSYYGHGVAGALSLGTYGLVLNPSGGTVESSSAITIYSDRRYKKDINYNFEYGLKEINLLKPCKFKYDWSDDTSLGFIAQDIEDLLPELIMKSKDNPDEKLGLRESSLISVLVKAIQELSEKVKKLES